MPYANEKAIKYLEDALTHLDPKLMPTEWAKVKMELSHHYRWRQPNRDKDLTQEIERAFD